MRAVSPWWLENSKKIMSRFASGVVYYLTATPRPAAGTR
jgi:hypothetical protein